MINKKLGILALSLAAMGLASCGGDNGGGETVIDLSKGESITYWCPDTDVAFFEAQVKEFKKAHPEFKGDITSAGTVGEGAVKDEIAKDVEKAADVFEIADDNLPNCVAGRQLTAFDADDVKTMKNRYGDTAVTAATVRGKVYGVPYRNDNGYVLSYDKDIVSAEDAKTVEGIIKACKAKGATFNFNLTDAWYTFAPVWAAGGKTYTDDEGTYHSEIANETVAQGVADFTKILKEAGNTFVNSVDDSKFGAAENRVGAVIKWNNEKAQKEILGDKLVITTLPSFTSGGKQLALKSFQGYKAIGMRQAKAFTEGKKVTARAFALFMGSDAVAEARLKQLGQGVSNKTVAEKKELWNSQWLSALSAQQAAGNTISQANAGAGTFWAPAGSLGEIMLAGTCDTAAEALKALKVCETAQNTVA